MVSVDQEQTEARRLEKVLTLQRWLYIPAVLLTAYLYDWLSPLSVIGIILLLILANLAAHFFLASNLSPLQQTLASLGLLIADIFTACWMIILAVREGHTAAIIIFAPMIVEAAIRFGLKGSLIADIFFALGLLGIRALGETYWGMDYPLADYVLTVGVMSFVSLMVGMVSREWRHHRRQAEHLAGERASLLERRRISNELHDSVLKSLEGLALEAHTLRAQAGPSPTSVFAEQSRYVENVCRQISREIRDVIFEMHDEAATKDIIEHLSKLISKWEGEEGIGITFTHNCETLKLPWRLAHNTQKVAEEALANVRRHSYASHVCLDIIAEVGAIKLSIRDNGRGFNTNLTDIYALAHRGKLGLITIKERVEMAGGNLKLESSACGTNIEATIPVPENLVQLD